MEPTTTALPAGVTMKVTVGGRWDFPQEKPERIELLPDRRKKAYMPDGMVYTIPPYPQYLLEYHTPALSPRDDDYFTVAVSVSGKLYADGLYYQVWNHDKDQLRHYRFDRTLRLVRVGALETLTGEEACQKLGGRAEEPFVQHQALPYTRGIRRVSSTRQDESVVQINCWSRLSYNIDLPPSKPLRVTPSPARWHRAEMPDGIVLHIPPWPCYLLKYHSETSTPDQPQTIEIPITLTGRLLKDGEYFEAWNFDAQERQCFRFDRTVELAGVTALSGLTAERLREALEAR